MRLEENAVVAGRFRLNHLLGRGGMGSVWHATHLGLDIPCAVKFVKGELAEQEDIKQRFEREAKAAAQLRSPHVVQILDHGVCEGTPYIAMELLDGEDLGVRLQKVGRLTPEQLHKIMSEASRALGKAHAQGIVHRDLKPDNIFLVRDDDREITKVLDFGIAKTRSNELGGSSTKTGAMLGTPYYMSPEQAQGTKTIDFRSDLWSLAVIAFQCLTGKLPFESEALGDLLVKIIISPIPTPSQYAPVPTGFDRWWMKAAARDPADRFQSAKEFSDSLAIVCGVSHVSGVVDRSQLRIVAENAPGQAPGQAKGGAGLIAAPSATSSQPGTQAMPLVTPAPTPAGQQPLPGTLPTPLVHRVATPVGGAGFGSQPGVDAPAGATPPPMSRSYAGEAPGNQVTQPSKAGVVVAVGIGVVLVAGALLGVGWYAFREHGAASSGPAAASSAGATPTPTTPATTSPPPPPPASASASASPPPAPTPAPVDTSAQAQGGGTSPQDTPSGDTPSHHAGGGQASGGSTHGKGGSTTKPTSPTGPATPPAKPPSKPGQPELGF